MPAVSRMRALLALAIGLGLLSTVVSAAHAQIRWTADQKASLAWWQINPHMNHLWATTCPAEPSWRPGEGRSAGWVISRAFRPAKRGEADVSDTTIIPLYPRRRVRSVCTEAVEARVFAVDTSKWAGVRGEVTVKPDFLVGGYDVRDEFTREKLLQTTQYPEIKFTIDSLTEISRHRDTVHAVALGIFTLRGVAKQMRAALRFWPEEGGMRVLGKIKIPAHDLIPVYGMSGYALGMGVGTNIWDDLYVGVDLLLRRSEAANSTN